MDADLFVDGLQEAVAEKYGWAEVVDGKLPGQVEAWPQECEWCRVGHL